MQLSKQEAADALALIQRVRADTLWILMGGLAQSRGMAGILLFKWISLAGGLASFAIGFWQSRQVRRPVDRRFVGALAALVVFGVLFLLVLHPDSPQPQRVFGYIGLLVAQCYCIAGIWFDTYLLWFGLLLAGLILVGLVWLMPVFWFWIAGCCGGAFILTGFYVRYFWRD
jgi:hypothetical protein